MLEVVKFFATLCCSIFAGAAIYINLVEHPARMGCDTKTAATVWAPSYKLATIIQVSLTIVSFVSGVMVWILGGSIIWLIGAAFIGSVVPFTLIIIMPTNRKLLMPGRDLTSEETRILLEKWGRLHAARSVLSLAAATVYIILTIKA